MKAQRRCRRRRSGRRRIGKDQWDEAQQDCGVRQEAVEIALERLWKESPERDVRKGSGRSSREALVRQNPGNVPFSSSFLYY